MDQKNCGGARHSDQDYTSKLLSRACLPLKGCFFRGALVGLGHRSLVDFVLGDDSVPVIVWFADRLPSCGHEWRQVRLYPQDFDDIGVAIKRAWEDKCQDQKCHFALIRPQPSHLFAVNAQLYALVFRPLVSLPSFKAVLVVSSRGRLQQEQRAVQYESRACLIESQIRDLRLRLWTEVDEFASVELIAGMMPQKGSFYSNGDLVEVQIRPLAPVSEDDSSSFMQAAGWLHDPIFEYVRLTVPHPVQIVVWFHPTDEIRFACRRYVTFAPRLFEPIQPQIRGVWSHVYGRRASFLFPVRPAPMSAIV